MKILTTRLISIPVLLIILTLIFSGVSYGFYSGLITIQSVGDIEGLNRFSVGDTSVVYTVGSLDETQSGQKVDSYYLLSIIVRILPSIAFISLSGYFGYTGIKRIKEHKYVMAIVWFSLILIMVLALFPWVLNYLEVIRTGNW